MKTFGTTHWTGFILALACLAASVAHSQSIPGLPEPGLAMYGSITTTNGTRPSIGSGVVWRVSTGATAITIPATVVTVNNQTFYILRVPFETRTIPGTTTFAATPNTLELTSATTTYTRSATVSGTSAILQGPGAPGTFTFGATAGDRGRIERLDLVANVPPASETFAEWALRIFHTSSVDPNADPDHDGASNMQEYLAGTDPLNAQSVFKFITIQPALPNGIIIQWSSVTGRSYTVERSSLVGTNYAQLGSVITATNDVTLYYDSTATGQGPYFYRLGTQ